MTAPAFTTESVNVVPLMAVMYAPVPMPLPVTYWPVAKFDALDTTIVDALELPVAVGVLYLSRIFQHSSYKYPALELGCRDGEFTQHLIASDPLYIADVHTEFLTSAVSMFPEEYQARVRKYLIKDNNIQGLPENQFGFIFSYNFFNYLSFDSIKQLMISAQRWLRPGGTIIFTYNNSDIGVGAAYAESYYMSYVPRSMLVPMCESLGFELIDHRDYDPNISWVEFRKHGTLTTVKASQALGEIMHIHH